MAEPLVVRLMREFKAALLAREAAQMAQMARRWIQVEDALEVTVDALAEQIFDLRQSGEVISPARLIRLDRYRALLSQTEREISRYVDNYADPLITRQQLAWGQQALTESAEIVNASYISAGRVPILFDVLPVDAIESLVGLAGDGSPLANVLRNAFPEASQAMTQELLRAVAIGQNPRETARRVRQQGLSQGLNRTLTIARTEQLRVYRDAGRQQYQNSGVVTGYRRLATHDDRVCPACLMAEGTQYLLDEALDEHPNGRCAQVPIVKDLPQVRWTAGPAWFNQQDAATQRAILGPGRYDAWRAGEFDLNALISRRPDDTWGASLQPTPLRDLTG